MNKRVLCMEYHVCDQIYFNRSQSCQVDITNLWVLFLSYITLLQTLAYFARRKLFTYLQIIAQHIAANVFTSLIPTASYYLYLEKYFRRNSSGCMYIMIFDTAPIHNETKSKKTIFASHLYWLLKLF